MQPTLHLLDACCSDYNIALRIELKRREIKDDPRRIAELAAYFTHCNLQVGWAGWQGAIGEVLGEGHHALLAVWQAPLCAQ